jgi:hypothetical protein
MLTRLNLRLDRKTRVQIARAARRLGLSKAEVMRRALRSWAEFVDSSDSPYHLLVDLIGEIKNRKTKRPKKSCKPARKARPKKRKRP